jgi:hypothetical protein
MVAGGAADAAIVLNIGKITTGRRYDRFKERHSSRK